jgi:serine protease SohB
MAKAISLVPGRAAGNGTPLPAIVIDFTGDTKASGHEGFAKLMDEVLDNKGAVHDVILRVTSPGGGVAQYGLMYAQVERLRTDEIPVTACVDTVAASGGLLMIMPANKIVCAPMSIIGSIGVVSEFLNFHRFLKGHNIDPLTLTQGKFKRTLTPTGEITEEGLAHYNEQLKTIHAIFTTAVTHYRPAVDPATTCNGDHWIATEAVAKNLGPVDEICTSQAYLMQTNRERDLVFIRTRSEGRFEHGLFRLFSRLCDHVMERLSRAHLNF